MVVFAIPLRAKETSKDWDGCVRRFNHTLASLFNQTNRSFRCIVACNQIPPLDREYDDRLEFIPLDIPVPTEWVEMARDKFFKLTVIAVRIREILEEQPIPEQGIYVMPVDADDLLNCRIAEYCEQHPNENGLVSKDGYVWQEGKCFFRIYPQMHTYCGSCNIIKMYREDLPEKCPVSQELCHDKETAGILNARYPIRFDHGIVVDRYGKAGRPFATLPFRSTVYVRGTGDNISAIYHAMHHAAEEDRFHPIAFLRSMNILTMRLITGGIRREFGMDGSSENHGIYTNL